MRALVAIGVTGVLLRTTLYLSLQRSLEHDAACDSPAGKRCVDLCKSNAECASLCEQVRSMICEPVPSEPDTVSSSAVAAATATEAVRSAVAQVLKDAKAATAEADASVQAAASRAISEAANISSYTVVAAAQKASEAASEAAAKVAAERGKAMATTAAAAAVAAVKGQQPKHRAGSRAHVP
jgi:NaMN:DMB phosphoribosyltransferase